MSRRRKDKYDFSYDHDPVASKKIQESRARDFRNARISRLLEESKIFQKYLNLSSRLKTYKVLTVASHRNFFGFAPPNWRSKYYWKWGIPVSQYEYIGETGDYVCLFNRKTKEFRWACEPKYSGPIVINGKVMKPDKIKVVILAGIFFLLTSCSGVQQPPWPSGELLEPVPTDVQAPSVERMYNVANIYCSQMFDSWPCTSDCYYEPNGWETTCDIWTADEAATMTCHEDEENALLCTDEFISANRPGNKGMPPNINNFQRLDELLICDYLPGRRT